MSTLTSLLVTGETRAEEVLNLPKGRLKIGEFVADFSPETVLSYAAMIINSFERAEDHDVEQLFVSQAGVIEYAYKKIGSGKFEVETF